ncbi:MAG: hypothetical protein ACRDP4_11000, partial [Nocardioidaceae bacterium]
MTIRPHISSLTSLAVPEAPSVAPGGARVAYTLRSCDEDAAADRVVRSLWQVGAGGANPHRLTQGNDDRSPTWSPDGRH